jgi:hypothetical protein
VLKTTSNWSTYPTRYERGKGEIKVPEKKIPLLELIILALTIYWLLSFFGPSIVPGVPHTARFIDLLAVIIVVLIIMKFLSYESSHIFNLLMVVDVFSRAYCLDILSVANIAASELEE